MRAAQSQLVKLRYIKDWVCHCLLFSYQKVRGCSIFQSNHVIIMTLGHGLRPVKMIILTLTFPWKRITSPIKVLLPVCSFSGPEGRENSF